MSRKTYAIDANVFITLHRYYPLSLMPDLWHLLDDLVIEQKLISHQIIFEELVPDTGAVDDVGKWAEKNKPCFKSITQEQTNLLTIVLKDFPKLIKAENPKNQADPWLVAMAMEHQRNPLLIDPFEMIVVTDENRRSPEKLPAACLKFNISHLNRFEFFEENGFRFSVTKA